MAKLKELLGESYKEGMTFEEAEAALAKCNLADLNKGEYVSKAKYDADTKLLGEYKAQAEGKQAEIDAAVKKAVDEAKAAAKGEYDKALETERTAAKRKRAREKAYEGLTDEQKGILDAFVKDEDLKLSEDGECFSNFDEATKEIKEKYKSLFPKDDGSNDKGGLPPAKGETPKKFDEYADYAKLR